MATIVEAPSGTDKCGSAQLTIAMLSLFATNNNQKHRTLVVSSVDTAADRFARKTYELGMKIKHDNDGSNARELVVIRMHATAAEREVALQTAGNGYDIIKPRQPKGLTQKGVLLRSLHMVRRAKSDTERGLPEADSRFQSLEFSLAWWVARLTGLLPWLDSSDPFARASEHKAFRDLYMSYESHGMPDRNTRERLKDLLDSVSEDLLSKYADVLVTTCSFAGDGKLVSNFAPDGVVIDATCRELAASILPTITLHYPATRWCMRLEQDRSATPDISIDRGVNALQLSSISSLCSEFSAAGPESLFANVEKSFPSSITCLLSEVFYESCLIPFLDLDTGKDAVAFRTWMAKHYISNQLNHIMFHVRNSRCQKRGESKFNQESAAAVISVLKKLLSGGWKLAQIAIYAPYRSQIELIQRFLTRTSVNGKVINQSHLTVRTFDNLEPNERAINIVDFTVTDTPGFLTEPERISAVLEHPKSGLILLGNVDELQRSLSRRVKLRQVVECCMDNTAVVPWTEPMDPDLLAVTFTSG